ncbi:MAG: DUF4082 domain-containing protein [Candidatus Fermentibacteraceae bacterium]|nr:DUF4082 domain-containing protein [Candidatus Fermentibacteraceae bacterium]MBN2608558.1 DUF4082 domain-containing protein [Candidatus Fermentibacteraceae bacterium]
MRAAVYGIMLLVCAPVALGQAIIGFAGGSQYDSYYGSASGDVIGWRFTVNDDLYVTDLGVWNADQTGGIESPHQVGIWDGSQNLVTSATVDAGGTVVGDWIYASVAPTSLFTGQTYTIGALYFPGDSDYYISSASSMTAATEITWLSSVYPASSELGFVFPASTSTSIGRFGPNFLFGGYSLEQTTWGAIKATMQ